MSVQMLHLGRLRDPSTGNSGAALVGQGARRVLPDRMVLHSLSSACQL